MNINQTSVWTMLLILSVGLIFSVLIPPFQSPDEMDHIKRAYLLSKGVIILDTQKGTDSGGMIDSGLASYFNAHLPLIGNPVRKWSAEEAEFARNIRWTGSKEFSYAPGAAYYFPVIYAPQALGFMVGEQMGLTNHVSYLLARFLVLVSIAVILIAAFRIYPVSPFTIALLIIPMSIFQFSSASLDGMATALSVLSIALFLRIFLDKENAKPWFFYVLTLAVVLVATSRVHLLPLVGLVFVACFYLKKRRYFFVFAMALVFIFAWLAIAVMTTVDNRVATGASSLTIASYYLTSPIVFLKVLFATLLDKVMFEGYWTSFFGVLGWFDAAFDWKIYVFLFQCTALIGLLSISFKNFKTQWFPRAIIFFGAVAAILLIFFALLVTWTPHPAQQIHGVQGRYFLVPMIMISYALSGGIKLDEGIARKLALFLVIFLGLFSIFSTTQLLIERYYLALEQPEAASIELRPSPALEEDQPIILFMRHSQELTPRALKRIGVQLGTYARTNPGKASLLLKTSEGHEIMIPFELSELSDNQYRYFDLDLMPYSSGQILYVSGSGISVWEAHSSNGDITTCLIFVYENDEKLYTAGCFRD